MRLSRVAHPRTAEIAFAALGFLFLYSRLSAAEVPPLPELVSRASIALDSAAPSNNVINLTVALAEARARVGDLDGAWSTVDKAMALAEIVHKDERTSNVGQVFGLFGLDRIDSGDKASGEKAIARAKSFLASQQEVGPGIRDLLKAVGRYEEAYGYECARSAVGSCDSVEGKVSERIHSGDIRGAEVLAMSIDQDGQRLGLLEDIVKAYLDRGNLTDAMRVAFLIEDRGLERFEAFKAIGDFAAARSDYATAFKAANQVKPGIRYEFLLLISSSQASGGDAAAAIATLDGMPADHESELCDGLLNIASILSRRGDARGARKAYAKALKAARSWAASSRKRYDGGPPIREWREFAETAVARVQVESGDWQDAVRTAGALETDEGRSNAYWHVAFSLVFQGKLREALLVADKICAGQAAVSGEASEQSDCDNRRQEILRSVALHQAFAGQMDDAIKTARLMRNEGKGFTSFGGMSYAGPVWVDFAFARARAGDSSGAMKFLDGIGDEYDRALVIGEIARQQANKGDFEGAYAWLDTIPGERRAEILLSWALGRRVP